MNKYFKIQLKRLKFEILSPVSSHSSSPAQKHTNPPHDVGDGLTHCLNGESCIFYSPFSTV